MFMRAAPKIKNVNNVCSDFNDADCFYLKIILTSSKHNLESDVCCRLQVEKSYEGKRRPGRKQWQTTARYMA